VLVSVSSLQRRRRQQTDAGVGRESRVNVAVHTDIIVKSRREGIRLSKIPYEKLMDVPSLLDRNGLLAAWRRLATGTEFGQRDWSELDERGEVVENLRPSARRQIVLTDVYCHVTEQIGHLAAMSVPVTTSSFGIRVPDVVWMPCDKWEAFDRDDPVPFVPDLCVEVLLDSDRTQDIDRRVKAYLEGGAREVIVVGQCGQVEFWGARGQRQASIFGIALSLDRMYFEEGGVTVPGVRC
jgi:Uma2 family endonuclease